MVWPGQFLSVPQGTDWQHKVIGKIFLSQSNRFCYMNSENVLVLAILQPQAVGPPTQPQPQAHQPPPKGGWLAQK